MSRKLHCLWLLLGLTLVACTPTPAPAPVPSPTPAPATSTPFPPTPTVPPRILTICTGAEPTSLYLYEGRDYTASLIAELLYDAPIDRVDLAYDPVLLERLPSLADGSATRAPVVVREGDSIINADGALTTLQAGQRIFPAGCCSAACAITYEGGDVQLDRLVVTFTMRSDLHWSDGTPLVARDSVLSYAAARHQLDDLNLFTFGAGLPHSGASESVLGTADYVALDDRRVRWEGLPGFCDPHYGLNFFTPLPAHLLAGVVVDGWAELPFWRQPPGWGPYRITGWTPGQGMELERNPYYAHPEGVTPYFDEVAVRFSGQDNAALVEAVEFGQCDVVTSDALLGAPDLSGAAHARLYTYARTFWVQVSFGRRVDAPLRRALALCIDRQAIAAQHSAPEFVMDAYVPPFHPLASQPGTSVPDVDPDAARAALDELGWRDADGDGVREAHGVAGSSDGAPLSLTLLAMISREPVAQQVASQLAACGIEADVEVLEPLALYDPESGRMADGDFDLALVSVRTASIPPCELYLSPEAAAVVDPPEVFQLTGYADPAYDETCLAALAALPGTDPYTTYHVAALRQFASDLPAVPLYLLPYHFVARDEILGIPQRRLISSETATIELWRRAEP